MDPSGNQWKSSVLMQSWGIHFRSSSPLTNFFSVTSLWNEQFCSSSSRSRRSLSRKCIFAISSYRAIIFSLSSWKYINSIIMFTDISQMIVTVYLCSIFSWTERIFWFPQNDTDFLNFIQGAPFHSKTHKLASTLYTKAQSQCPDTYIIDGFLF